MFVSLLSVNSSTCTHAIVECRAEARARRLLDTFASFSCISEADFVWDFQYISFRYAVQSWTPTWEASVEPRTFFKLYFQSCRGSLCSQSVPTLNFLALFIVSFVIATVPFLRPWKLSCFSFLWWKKNSAYFNWKTRLKCQLSPSR